jgi:hypothetical protein
MKKLLTTLLLTLIIFMMIPASAYANSPKPKPSDLTLVFYDLPKGSTVDILVNDMALSEDTITTTNHSCEHIQRYSEDGYLALAARCNDIDYSFYYKVPVFSGRKSYHILNINFKGKSPNDYKVIVCNPSEKLILSDFIRYERYSAKYFNYTEESLKISDIHYKNDASFLQKFIISVTSLVMALVVTLVIESLLALLIKLGKLHIIILTNLVSNVTMNVILLKLIKGYDLPYILVLMVLELLAIIIEFFVYKHAYKKEQSTKKIFIYTIVANALSCIVFLVLYSGVFRYFAI